MQAASLEGWHKTTKQLGDLAALHAWLHSEHACYAVARQVLDASQCILNRACCVFPHSHARGGSEGSLQHRCWIRCAKLKLGLHSTHHERCACMQDEFGVNTGASEVGDAAIASY